MIQTIQDIGLVLSQYVFLIRLLLYVPFVSPLVHIPVCPLSIVTHHLTHFNCVYLCLALCSGLCD